MASFLDLATDSLVDIGVLARGETPTADQANAALRAANEMIDEWATQDLFLYSDPRSTFTITANDGEYTVGSGGNVNVARPVAADQIDAINLIDTTADPDLELPLRKLSNAEWQATPQKAATAAFPTSWFYDPTHPLGTLFLLPVPTSSSLQGAIYAPSHVVEFAALTTTISLPPGYRMMIRKGLALQMAPGFGREVGGLLAKQAAEAIASVKRRNRRKRYMRIDPALTRGRGRYNIYSGG